MILLVKTTLSQCLFPLAAVPTTSGDGTDTMNVFDGVPAELNCAIPLGALADHLHPYTVSWNSLNAQGFSIPVNPSQYSNNNRTLTILVNDNSANFYRCVLRLRRCDITRSNGSPRCPAQIYFGNLTRIAVFGKDDYSLQNAVVILILF